MTVPWRKWSIVVPAVTLAALWLTVSAAPQLAVHFGIIDFLKGGNMAAFGWAWGIAQPIVAYLNSWWGFAMAVGLAAAIGMSWSVVLIRSVLAREGFAFAVRWATYL